MNDNQKHSSFFLERRQFSKFSHDDEACCSSSHFYFIFPFVQVSAHVFFLSRQTGTNSCLQTHVLRMFSFLSSPSGSSKKELEKSWTFSANVMFPLLIKVLPCALRYKMRSLSFFTSAEENATAAIIILQNVNMVLSLKHHLNFLLRGRLDVSHFCLSCGVTGAITGALSTSCNL